MTDKYALSERLRILIGDYLRSENIILIDLRLHSKRKKTMLRILVDEPNGGISLDRCAHLNSAISQLLDKEDLIQHSYILEVSSPGLDRPLQTYEDFSRCLNRKVRVFFNQCQDGKYEIYGVVICVNESGIELDTGEQVQRIPFERIGKAKQIIGEVK